MDDLTSPSPARADGQAPVPPDEGQLALMALLLSTSTLDDFLDGLVTSAAAALGPEVSCGVTVRRERSPMTVASSDALARSVDEIQYAQGAGPCLEALDAGRVVPVADMFDEHRWEGYPTHALAQGVRSSLSLPMAVGGSVVGALNLYSGVPRRFADAARAEQAAAFAEEGSVALGVALRQAQESEVTGQLREALTSRSVIDQAMGIIMAQQRCSSDAAFAILRSASQNRNRKLRDIAADLVTAVSGQPSEPRHFDTSEQPPGQ